MITREKKVSGNGHWSVLIFRDHGNDKNSKKILKESEKLGEKPGEWMS